MINSKLECETMIVVVWRMAVMMTAIVIVTEICMNPCTSTEHF